jgi:phosphoinositide 3-kinase adapter protein 1
LHFAARWGLENLCLQLLECPGGEIACEMRNVSFKTPGELAESAGFIKLAGSFKNYSVSW